MGIRQLRGKTLYLLMKLVCGTSFMMYGVSGQFPTTFFGPIGIIHSNLCPSYSMMLVYWEEYCCTSLSSMPSG